MNICVHIFKIFNKYDYKKNMFIKNIEIKYILYKINSYYMIVKKNFLLV